MNKEIVAGEGLYNEYLCKVSGDGKVILAVNTETNSLYKKVENSWQELTLPPTSWINQIDLNYTGDTIYISVGENAGDLYKSTDGGETWTLITSYLVGEEEVSDLYICAMATNSTGQHIVMLVERDGEPDAHVVCVSHNYGATWQRPEVPQTSWWFAATMNESGSTMLISGMYDEKYQGDSLGLGISTDFGQTWRFPDFGFIYVYPAYIACSESGQYMYWGGEGSWPGDEKLFISEDYGYTWTELNQPPPEDGSLYANAILCDSSGEKLIALWHYDMIYYNANNVFYYSSDKGQNWEEVQLSEEESFSDAINFLNIDMSRNGEVIALGTKAKNWAYSPNPPDIHLAHVWISESERSHIKAISTALFRETVKKVSGVTKDELSKIATQDK